MEKGALKERHEGEEQRRHQRDVIPFDVEMVADNGDGAVDGNPEPHGDHRGVEGFEMLDRALPSAARIGPRRFVHRRCPI